MIHQREYCTPDREAGRQRAGREAYDALWAFEGAKLLGVKQQKNMCLFPKLIYNKKYVSNKKNGGIIPPVKDKRTLLVPTGCGKCMECKKQKARGWSIRLQEEIKLYKSEEKLFVTLTFSNESIAELAKDIKGLSGYNLDNEIATLGTRRFLERWRKKYKRSIKHWFVTELGSKGTENVHIHGIIFLNSYKHDNPIKKQFIEEQRKDIKEIWQYGFVYIGDYVNEETINYCVKYSVKTDLKHPNYNAKILTSPAIGANYLKSMNAERHRFNGEKTIEEYKTAEGHKIAMPTYWRNKIFTDEEREELWLNRLNKLERYVDGSKIDISKDDTKYMEALVFAREKNKRLGYGNDQINQEKRDYENKLREINFQKRAQKILNSENA